MFLCKFDLILIKIGYLVEDIISYLSVVQFVNISLVLLNRKIDQHRRAKINQILRNYDEPIKRKYIITVLVLCKEY